MARPDETSLAGLLAAGAAEGATGRPAGLPRVGALVGSTGASLLVDYPGNPHGPLPARSLAELAPATLRAAVEARREVVLLFDGGDERRPIVIGLLGPELATPALDAALAATSGLAAVEATVDGQRLVLEGQEEVLLRCGEASITLRRDGRVVIRGLYVETHASGTNRVKGATVKIN
jgi:hypothetical protein